MGEYLHRMMGGPGSMRFYIQPSIALLLGLRDGARDARLKQHPFLFALATHKGERGDLLKQAIAAIVVPLCIATAASLVIQYLVVAKMHLLYALLYAFIFVALPYGITRGLANRAFTAWGRRRIPPRGPAEQPT
jgi:hypothetical protein